MDNDKKQLHKVYGIAALVAILCASLVAMVSYRPVTRQPLIGGLIHNTQESFDAGIAVGGNEVISSARAVKPVTLTVGSGTAISQILSATAAVNPDSIAAYDATTTNITVTGAAVGDSVTVTKLAYWAQSTSTLNLSGYVSAVDTVTLRYGNTSATALDMSLGTVRVMVTKF